MLSVFQKFGGIRPMAAKLGVPPSTIKSWHRESKIPAWRHDAVISAAARHGIDLKLAELTEISSDLIAPPANDTTPTSEAA